MSAMWSVEQRGDAVTLHVRGDVDMESGNRLTEEIDGLVAGEPSFVLVDMRAVDFIDSGGLRAVLNSRRRHGHRVVLGAVSTPVARLFEMAGVADWLDDRTDPSASSGVQG